MPATNDLQVGEKVSSVLEKGPFVVALLSRIESAGHCVVYLRNYENLPDDIGNDVDILVESCHTKPVVELIRTVSPQYGWHLWKSVPFSSRSVFILNPDRCESLHIDISETIEWHCLPYADTTGIFARRQWNGIVNIPSTIDELYLNLTTRLLYQGVVREKHREQWRTALPSIDRAVFSRHVASQLASSVSEIYSRGLFAESWDDVENLAGKLRKGVMVYCLSKRLRETFGRVFAFAFRQFRRLACPPGLFIAFEGVDGVGKSAVMDRIMPALSEFGSLSPPMVFHWKPSRRSNRMGGRAEPHNADNCSKAFCHLLIGLFILFYHWFGFWWGYLRYVLPQRARNRVVVADSYAYGVLLDPAQYRLSLPECLLKLFCATVPRPDVVVALVADAERILERKQERSREEIGRYLDKLKSLAHPALRVVEANEELDQVARAVLAALYREIVGR
jgi:thymidylate kinase